MTPPTSTDLREEIARVIEPGAFDDPQFIKDQDWRHSALAKADAIIAAHITRLEGEIEDLSAYRDVINSATSCDQYDEAADKWLAMQSIDRMANAICSVFSKWASEEIMVRFREKVAALMHLAFVEGALVGQQSAEALASRLSEENARLKTELADFQEIANAQGRAAATRGLENARLREALPEGASWFDANADEHLAKGSEEKALRNKVRANILRNSANGKALSNAEGGK